MKKLSMVVVIIGLAVFMASHAFCGEKKEPAPDYGYGYHMMGRAYKPRALQSMKPEQREKWQKMRAAHMMDTMDLRMKLAAKRVELRTLWAQPEMDEDRIKKLSNEVSELQAGLLKMRNQHLLQCRQKFGGQGWDCPGGW